MPRRPRRVLHVDLQDGWFKEPVIVRVNGTEVFRGEVTTKFQIGKAKSLDVPVKSGQVEITIEAPSRQMTRVVELTQVGAEHWVGVTASDSGIDITEQVEPFRYA